MSWERRFRQAELATTLRAQAATNAALVGSYREQFKVGQRSLLDVLDAQNTRFNTETLADTARLRVAVRGIPAAGRDRPAAEDAGPLARQAGERLCAHASSNAAHARDVETYARTPSEQENDLPFDILGADTEKIAEGQSPSDGAVGNLP